MDMRLPVIFFLLFWAKARTLTNLNYSVPEEQGPGTVIGNIAKDAGFGPVERGGKSNFRVLENSAPHLIDVDPESGLLFTKQRIDRETLCRRNPKCQLSMEVFANDKEICMIKIDVVDINDNSPSFPSDHINIDISENAAAGTRFPLTIAHDSDSGGNGVKSYQVTRDDYNTFSLDLKLRGEGTIYPELVVQRPLDREDQSHHTLLLTAIDGGENPRSGSMQINVRVTDSNDNSPVFDKPAYVLELPENSPPGKMLIDLNATDQDEGSNGQVVYSFSGYASDRVQELFSIDPNTGVIKIQGEIDYEENPTIEFDVQAKDLGPNPIPGHCKISVKVLDKNDNWPVISFVSVRQGAISEAAPPESVIALVRVTDKDSGRNGQLQCRVLGNVPFRLQENNDNFYTLLTDRPLDRELKDEYNVTIVARDNGIPSLNYTKSFTVKILDENDNAPRFTKTIYMLQVPENNIPGEYLGSVLAHDPDIGRNGTVSYSILPSHIGDVSVYTYVSVNPTNGAIYASRSFNYEQTKFFEFNVQAKDAGSPHMESSATVRVGVLDVNDNLPFIVLPLLINDTAEIMVPRNVGLGYIVTTVRAVDHDYGESGRLTYEISEGNEEHLFEMDPVAGEVRTAHAVWEDVASAVELVVKVTDHGKPPLSAVAKLIIKANTGAMAGGESRASGEQQHWDLSLPLIVTLCIISVMLLAVMTAIAVKSKHQDKEAGNYKCRMAEYSNSNPPVGKGKKKRINKNEIMLVQSEMEERDSVSRMNVVSSPSLITSPICFDYQTTSPLPLTLPRSEVMYLKTTSNSLTAPRAGCHSSFAGLTTETTMNRMSVIQTDNFPSEPNYAANSQPFAQSSSTFKDAEQASLRDSGHGDSDQADSDQDTNKGSHCDTSAREALKMKATAVNGQPLEQGQGRSVHCTDECRALGHSDRCWMPKLHVGSQADSADNRTNLFIPVGMEAMVETEIYGSLNRSAARKTLSTFGKEQRDSIILVANVKPYLKSQRGLSPLLQECSSMSSSPTKGDTPLDSPTKGPREEVGRDGEGDSDSSAYGPPDGQCSPPHTELEEPSYLSCDLSPKSLSNSLIHSSGIRSGIISQECGGTEYVSLDQRESGN
ncbi:protocadherin-17-like [Coregonus clupeaformis]|uniref:protocadherin-17-like n=1 Tax=Coregonus clupeaformis TaxID=59861 RepID=UPI001E1C705A|nr:protocadherin-17-like [Coregonus clupeaformis]